MRIEHIAQRLSLSLGYLFGITILVRFTLKNPPIGLEVVLVLDDVSVSVFTHLATLQTTHSCGSSTIDKMDKSDKLFLILNAEFRNESTTIQRSLSGCDVSTCPPTKIKILLCLCLIISIGRNHILLIPRETVCRCDGELIVVIAHAEQIAIASFQGKTISINSMTVTVFDVAECKDMIVALAARSTCRITAVTIVYIIEIHLKTGTGRQHQFLTSLSTTYIHRY